jgi:hypothetical protein
MTQRYIYSGGRPGLVKEDVDVGDISYSISAKGALFNKSSAEFIVLQAIFDCSNVVSEATSHEPLDISSKDLDDTLISFCDLLPDVLESSVRRNLEEKD